MKKKSIHLKSLLQKTRTESDVFARVAGSMAQVASQCGVSGFHIYFRSCWIQMWTCPVLLQRFYNSGCCTEPSDAERRHLSMFHQAPGSRNVPPPPPPDDIVRDSSSTPPPGGARVTVYPLSHLHVNYHRHKKRVWVWKLKFVCWQSHLSPDDDVDVDIRVSPGTYAVTASMEDCEQQTLLVSLQAGESFKLQFNFWHQKPTFLMIYPLTGAALFIE